jgi:putative hydrolase of the HAD superfamily
MGMIKAIIFDFFDVIHDDPFKYWLRKNKLPRGNYQQYSDLVDVGEITESEYYQKLSTASGQSLESVEAIFHNTDLIDDPVIGLIKELQRLGYKLGLLSNSTGEYLRPILQKHQLEKLFDAVAISAEIGHRKPSPEIFAHILERLGAQASEALFIDDAEPNIDAASSLGIQALLFTDEGSLRTALKQRGIPLR